MDLLSFSDTRGFPGLKKGKSSTSIDTPGENSGGVGEQSRIVLGRSIKVNLECRRGTPTVDAGEGGKLSAMTSS